MWYLTALASAQEISRRWGAKTNITAVKLLL
jgi:hypothetical protein